MGFHFEMKLEDIPDGTNLQYYKDGKVNKEFISLEKFDEIMNKAKAYNELLAYLREEIRNKAQGTFNHNLRIIMGFIRRHYPGALPKAKS